MILQKLEIIFFYLVLLISTQLEGLSHNRQTPPGRHLRLRPFEELLVSSHRRLAV